MIFEVYVPDAVGMLLEPYKWIATTKAIVAGIQHQTQHLRVRHTQELGSLFWRFNPGADVVMKHGTQSGFTLYSACHAIRPIGKYLPLHIGHSVLWLDAARIVGTHGVAIGIVPQY